MRQRFALPEFDSEWVYSRDAAWYDRPNVRDPKRLHAARPDGLARCSSRILLDENTGQPRSEVPERLLCRRPACAAPSVPGGENESAADS